MTFLAGCGLGSCILTSESIGALALGERGWLVCAGSLVILYIFIKRQF